MVLSISAYLQRIITDYLEISPQSLAFTELHSEEAKVVKISNKEGDTIAWLKVHHSAEKARREVRSLREWGHLLNAPKVIAIIDDCCILLSHCRGQVVGQLDHAQAKCLGLALGKLHTYPVCDNDSIPLPKALELREEQLSNSLVPVSKRLRSEGTHYTIFQQLLKYMESLPHTMDNQEIRRPCHRDLKLDHLLFTCEHHQVIHLSVIDWGQSRADYWVNDWVSLVLGHHNIEMVEYAWSTYWQYRLERESSQLLSYHPLLSVDSPLIRAIAFYVLSTLRWADQHLTLSTQKYSAGKARVAQEVWNRGLSSLSWVNNQVFDK